VLLIGIPSGFALCLTIICDFFRFHFIGKLGSEIELAAFGIVQKVGNLTIQLSVGMAQGIRPLVAYNYASGDRKRMKAIMKGSAVAVLSFVVLCVALSSCFRGRPCPYF
jgi:Na+-driven multidrug efflux pump